jgi:hypothetical protein
MVEVQRLAGMPEESLEFWARCFSASTFRQRLHGWRLWQAFCVENGYGPEDMRTIANPPVVMISFLQALDKVDTP